MCWIGKCIRKSPLNKDFLSTFIISYKIYLVEIKSRYISLNINKDMTKVAIFKEKKNCEFKHLQRSSFKLRYELNSLFGKKNFVWPLYFIPTFTNSCIKPSPVMPGCHSGYHQQPISEITINGQLRPHSTIIVWWPNFDNLQHPLF